MTDQFEFSQRRRALLAAMAAAGAASSVSASAASAANALRKASAPGGGERRINQLIGANGWPMTPENVAMWKAMGLTWGRDSVGPGQRHSPDDPVEVDKTGAAFDHDLPPAILLNNRNGIHSLLLLGYTPRWNATVDGDSRSAPKDDSVWTRYVETVVRTYVAPPYNVRYFQIWNEAAGRLSGGATQATFWHGGKNFAAQRAQHAPISPYDRAMQDYVELVHVPAARIVRKYGGYVVYGGWPDQGGLETYMKWLEYRSPAVNARMIDWVDYLDTHYLGVDALTPLYERYVANGPARGVWQTEIGDRYMMDPHYLPMYFFKFADWALDHNWDDPNKYVSMVYHWDGFESYRLTHRGNPRTYNVSGKSLVVLNKTVGGALARFDGRLAFGQHANASGLALRSGPDLVVQVRASPGPKTLTLSGWSGAPSNLGVVMVDALSGEAADASAVSARASGGGLSIDFRVPDAVNGGGGAAPMHLAYLVVSPRA
ncbi:hypothetical protein [Trinickia dinghuensis]|uniref:Uncharacterized protein n=1 Tax=Trinickia dinghuensis TaxID=2291023 RepID=A0A3D8JY83_9BURK|nr:hypothetical protein [Trinickia dinghuensis]RDU97321.1 hypothetical protein DWV00_19000 [Trinickia dinghuensis]